MIRTIDLSAFAFKDRNDPATTQGQSDRLAAARSLVDACHSLGFVKITGHGLSDGEVDEAFGWLKRLFDLPTEEKMKAPHPPGPMPHRGYSGIGREKVYHLDDVKKLETETGGHGNVSDELRKISDFKESYEIGSEHDDQQQNIWLPDDVLDGFRTYFSALYERLDKVADMILDAIGVGLGLDEEAHAALMALHSNRHCQLRLLHYPAIEKDMSDSVFARLPAHNDWGTFTLLFQDSNGGLELMDPKSKEFIHATPEKGALVLNIGDMLQRFTNDYFISALHRVSVPGPDVIRDKGVPARYSIPYFIGPKPSHTIASLPQFVTADSPAKYEPVRFDEYGALISKYQYADGEKEKEN
ncbi:Clavaminate synthase-like protein [Rhypophila decipiens]